MIADFPFTVDVIYGLLHSHLNLQILLFLDLVSNVINLSGKDDPISSQQIWLRSTNDENDWFTLTNPNSGKILTASSATDLTVTGRYLL